MNEANSAKFVTRKWNIVSDNSNAWWNAIDDAENLYLDITVYNLIEYSSNYSETKRSLWFCFKDEATDFKTDIANTGNFKSFKYNFKLLGNIVAQSASNAANGILKT